MDSNLVSDFLVRTTITLAYFIFIDHSENKIRLIILSMHTSVKTKNSFIVHEQIQVINPTKIIHIRHIYIPASTFHLLFFHI